jgi:hypothetical protein
MAANLPHPFGGPKIPPPERLDPFDQFNRLNDALLGSQPGSMNEIFKELRERGGFEIEEDSDVTQAR